MAAKIIRQRSRFTLLLLRKLGISCISFSTLSAIALPVNAADYCQYHLGRSVTGQAVRLDLCSIQRRANRLVDFTYSLDGDSIQAQANCRNSTFVNNDRTFLAGGDSIKLFEVQ